MGFIRKILEKRSTTARNPADWLRTVFNGGPTTSGETVTVDKALSQAAFFAAVRAISEDIAKLPFLVYRRRLDGGKERVPDHPVYGLLHTRPNLEMSALDFRTALTASTILYGNGYAEIVRGPGGLPAALWPLPSGRVRVERGADRELRYILRPQLAGATEIVLPPEDVIHLRAFSSDGLVGRGIVELAKESIGLALAAEKSGAAFYGNSAMPDVLLKFPGRLDNQTVDRLRESWSKMHQGAGKHFRPAILENGMEVVSLTHTNESAQWAESRLFQVQEIARWLRISPTKLADLSRGTYTNSEQEARAYVTDTLDPWLVRWEQECTFKMLPDGDLYAEHLTDALLRGDTKTRYEAYGLAVQNGILTRNECRIAENRNPIAGGDELLQPLNMTIPGPDEPEVSPAG